LTQIVDVDSVTQNIAAAAQEQAASLQQVNTAVTQMDQTTQQNAAMVEESAAITQSLEKQADELSELVGSFRLDDGNKAAKRRGAAKPRSARAA
jgi:methyl-accepting chemotaxis protein